MSPNRVLATPIVRPVALTPPDALWRAWTPRPVPLPPNVAACLTPGECALHATRLRDELNQEWTDWKAEWHFKEARGVVTLPKGMTPEACMREVRNA